MGHRVTPSEGANYAESSCSEVGGRSIILSETCSHLKTDDENKSHIICLYPMLLPKESGSLCKI